MFCTSLSVGNEKGKLLSANKNLTNKMCIPEKIDIWPSSFRPKTKLQFWNLILYNNLWKLTSNFIIYHCKCFICLCVYVRIKQKTYFRVVCKWTIEAKDEFSNTHINIASRLMYSIRIHENHRNVTLCNRLSKLQTILHTYLLCFVCNTIYRYNGIFIYKVGIYITII